MFHLRFIYFMNAYLYLSSLYVSMYGCAYIHMCEMNIKGICSCVYVYMQMGVYITLFAYVYICVEMFMHVIFG